MSEVTRPASSRGPARSCIASLASCSAFGCVGVGQPRRRARPRRRVQVGGVDVAAVAVGGDDRQRGGVARRRPGACRRRPARTAARGCARPARPASSPGSSAPPRTSKPWSTSGSAEASVSNSRSRSTRNSRSSKSRWIWSRSHGCIRSVSGVCASGTSLTRSVSSRLSTTLRQVGAQRVADLALHRVDLVDQRLQRAVLGDPLGRGLLPHARDAGQVVARVAAQRREVRVLLRGQPVLLDAPPPG